ncbi:MAG: phosphoribosylformylglycinamidine synthase subunit PurL [Planctomycetota bacterium]|nr:MAG: phosphoribosylformylglycinamidine synthase subunit PurL [Planctomycetota bacterium]
MSGSYLVEVSRKAPEADPAGQRLLRLARAAGCAASAARVAELYEFGPVRREDAERIAHELLVDPVLDEARVSAAEAPGTGAREGEAVLTVLRRDGVMDPVALSAVVAARELGLELQRVRTARRYYLRGEDRAPTSEALARLASALHNPVVDRVVLGPDALPPPVRPSSDPTLRREVPIAGLDAEALAALSRERTLALDAQEMRCIQEHYARLGRAPSELELETIAQTWSEHCKHKTLTGPVRFRQRAAGGEVIAERRYENLLRETIFAATERLNCARCLSVFVDNAGVVRFDEEWGVAVKVETHNHPSAIEPYGGAGTGIGGVIRDILGTGLGARPLFNIDVFCIGDPWAEGQPPGTIHPRELLAGVVDGVRDYGNRMGIPTIAGALVSEPRYVGNPLVYAGTVGLIPTRHVGGRPRPGDWIVCVGGRTGRDGIHGATFSSDALHSESETQSGGAVQIGNPIAEKMLADVLLEVRDRGWLSAVTDCGAGGFSSAIGEMAEGLGARVDLARAPLKYAGLEPWEVWISEAQERMVLAVPPAHGPALLQAFAAEDVEATRLGTFDDSGLLRVFWGETLVGELDLEFLHDGLPRRVRDAEWQAPAAEPFAWPEGADAQALLEAILATPTVCSKEWILRQYDHEVQGTSALKALVGVRAAGPGDAAAVAPLPGSTRGVVVGLGLNPRHGDADPYQMALGAVDEALRNLVAVGADPAEAAVLDNFSWGDCRLPDRLGAMVLACEGCRDAALAYGVPFISGKDSLNNEYELPTGERVAIPHTLLVTAVAVCEDVRALTSMDFKGADHPVLLVGESQPALRGSLAAEVLGCSGGEGPRVDLARAPRVLGAVHAALRGGGVLACHDLSEGGLAVAAAEMAFAGGVGLELDLAPLLADGLDPLAVLFNEAPTRFLLEVEPRQLQAVEEALGDFPWTRIGRTVADPRLRARGPEGWVLDAPLPDLEAAWRRPLQELYA